MNKGRSDTRPQLYWPHGGEKPTKIALVGSFSGTHIAGSFARAAAHNAIDCMLFDVADSNRGNRLLRTISWRLVDRRPLRLSRFSADVVAACVATEKPDVLIATGPAALNEHALCALRARGVVCINYSTDDPWNPVHRARWHLRALPAYDIVFSPRRSTINDLVQLGCSDVRYLPFGYDEALFFAPRDTAQAHVHDVLFVGGADPERVAFMTAFRRRGPKLTLVGGYWHSYAAMRPYALGVQPPDALRALTTAARVNLCLVRRANRDGHVMRSFEIAATGGCMLVEDTDEHREIFGQDGEAVAYFRTAEEAALRAQALVADPAECGRLRTAVRARINSGAHTYGDRLATMLHAAAEYINARK